MNGLGGSVGDDGKPTEDVDFGDFSVGLEGASIIFKPKKDTDSSEPAIKIDGVEIKLS